WRHREVHDTPAPRCKKRRGQLSILRRALGYGYTPGMKTAVSIPDEVFEGAERLARKTKRSRRRLFSDALKEYLARHTPAQVTEAMDRALDELGQSKDTFVSTATRRVLARSQW